MTVASQQGHSSVTTVPEELESAQAKLVYLGLKTADGASVDELHSNVDVSKLTLHSILKTLVGRGIVREEDKTYYPDGPEIAGRYS